MRVKLGSGISIHGTGAIMFEFGGNHLAGGLGGMVAADSSLDVSFQLIQGDSYTFPVRFANSLVGPYKGSDRHTFRCTERGVPAGPMFGRLDISPVCILVFGCHVVLDKLLARDRVLPLGETIKLLPRNISCEPPLGGELPVPLPVHAPRLGVVVLLGIRELLLMVGVGLARGERF